MFGPLLTLWISNACTRAPEPSMKYIEQQHTLIIYKRKKTFYIPIAPISQSIIILLRPCYMIDMITNYKYCPWNKKEYQIS